MPADTVPNRAYRFGEFLLEPAQRRLLAGGQPVALTGRALDLLIALVERAGELVTKDQLFERVWPKLVVEDSNLQVHISALRKVLGQDAIATVVGRGYRFTLPVEDAAAPIAPAPLTPAPPAPEPPAVRRRTRAWWLVPAAAAILLIAGAGAWLTRERSAPPPATQQASAQVHSLAVLPFRHLPPADSRDEYLGVGLADALIVHLSSLPRLIVRPTSAVLRYDNTVDPVAAGVEQRVDAVLVGTIQHVGESIRVAAQLVNTRNGTPLWAGKFDERASDLFKLEDNLSEQIAKALLKRLDAEERKQVTKHYTEDAQANELYLRGKFQWARFSEDGINKAIGYYRGAIDRDPRFAQAYAGLAAAYNVRGAMGFALPREVWKEAREAADKAVAMDPTIPEAHVALAAERLLYAWDLDGAERELAKALELNPNNPEAYSLMGYTQELRRRFDDAIATTRRAVPLEPNSPLYNVDLASALYVAGRYEEALAPMQKVKELDPSFNASFAVDAQALERLGRYAEAIAACERAIKAGGPQPAFLSALAFAYASDGDRVRAQKVVDELIARWKRRYFPPTLIAIALAGLGESDQAIAWLEKAIEARDPQVLWFAVEPQLASLRGHAKWPGLVRKVGLPE